MRWEIVAAGLVAGAVAGALINSKIDAEAQQLRQNSYLF